LLTKDAGRAEIALAVRAAAADQTLLSRDASRSSASRFCRLHVSAGASGYARLFTTAKLMVSWSDRLPALSAVRTAKR